MKYVIRRPGNSSWAEVESIEDARKEKDNANRVSQPGHRIYKEKEDGTVEEVK